MRQTRPSSAAIQRSQTLKMSEEKSQNANFHHQVSHQGLLTLAKPVLLSRPQTAKLLKLQNPPNKVPHPCLTESKPLLSEKEINMKLHECLKADVKFSC